MRHLLPSSFSIKKHLFYTNQLNEPRPLLLAVINRLFRACLFEPPRQHFYVVIFRLAHINRSFSGHTITVEFSFGGMISAPVLSLLCMASVCVAFEFDVLGRPQLALYAPNDLNEALLSKAIIDEDNAGFERPQIFGGRSPSSTRRLLQEPPLKKRAAVEHKLIRGWL